EPRHSRILCRTRHRQRRRHPRPNDRRTTGTAMSETETATPEAETAAPEKKDSRPIWQKPFFWVVVVVALAALIGGTLHYQYSHQFESTDDAFVDAHIVRIAPEISGTLVSVANLDNRHVKAGELLAVIKPSGPEAQLAEANAGVDQALAQLQQAQAQVASA